MEVTGYYRNQDLSTNLHQLFNRAFMVKMAYIDLLGTEEIQRYGYVSSGDPEDDRCNANEKIVVGMTIPKLLEFFRNKVPFYLVNISEEHVMYNIIATHLKQWREWSETSFNMKRIPYQDLVDLSEMAKLVYRARDRSKDQIIEDEMSKLNAQFGDIEGMISVQDLLVKPERKKKEREVIPHLQDASVLNDVFGNRGGFR